MNEKKSFWNWIGLPDSSDIHALQDLLQTQSEQLARMEEENQRLGAILERAEERIGQLETENSAITQTLNAMRTETAAQMEKLSFADGKTYDALMKNAQNQDELLRILIVNTLQKELEATLDSGLSKKAQTSKGRTKRKV